MSLLKELNTPSDIAEIYDDLEYSGFSSAPADAALIKRAIQGEKEAFERLFVSTYRYVFSVCRRYLKNDQDTYDAIQDTYLSVLSGIKNLRDSEAFYPWLGKVAQNCSFAVWNKNHPGVTFEEYDPNTEDETDGDPAVSADVTEVLKELPAEQVELLIRLYYDKLTVSEIARLQGLPRTTVSNRIRVAKKNLKAKLKLRGIEKPLYSGEFISMIANALRYAIGTRLLSMAVAQEILCSVTGSKDKKAVAVIMGIARSQRNSEALKIAGMLLFGAVLIALIIIMLIILLSGGFFGAGSGNTPTASAENSGASSYEEPHYSLPSGDKTDLFSSDSSSSQSGSSSGGSSSVNTSSSGTSSKPSDTGGTSSSGTSSKPASSQNSTSSSTSSSSSTPSSSSASSSEEVEEQVEFLGSPYSSETFGREKTYGSTDYAIVGDTVYSVENGDLVSKNVNGGASTVHIKNFTETYGSSVGNLNVYDGKVYWVGPGNEDDYGYFYTLNRCNLDGTGYYCKRFDRGYQYEALAGLTVAKDGVWFYTWEHGHGYGDEHTLYKTDYSFNVECILGAVDYALVGDKIYYLSGSGNVGTLYSANRSNCGNKKKISSVTVEYGGIWSYGDYIVVEPRNGYGMDYAVATDIIIIDTTTDKIVGRIKGTSPTDLIVRSVSGENGGTVVYSYSGNKYSYTVQTRKTEKIS